MNPQESSPASDNEPASTAFPFVWIAVGLVAVFLTGLLFSAAAVEQLVLGWLYFPFQVLPQVSVYWPSVVLGAICCVAFVFGLHFALKRSRSSAEGVGTEEGFGTWSLRSSLAVAMGVALLFAAGTAMVAASPPDDLADLRVLRSRHRQSGSSLRAA